MGGVNETWMGRIRGYLRQKQYDIGMWLAVKRIYPDADPGEFQLLDTVNFIAVERQAARTTWDGLTDEEREIVAWHAMIGE